ncbi:MAG TPA: phosphate ABC transporter substrate-binding protein PstS [Homoserinimonas sp.]|nr:phosphate ABC transporter substrate-binding protein PstS [Homoserinimonas sp.]
MSFSRRVTIPLALLGATLLLTSCAVNELNLLPGSDLTGTVVGGGASSQQAAQETWVSGFQSLNPNATVEYDPAGSGAGRDMFIAGGASFAGSDRAFTDEELATKEFKGCAPGSGIIELPTYIAPIVVVFQLNGVNELKLDPGTIGRIFAGDIDRWNDPLIREQNPNTDLPDMAITAVHRSDESGTTENFTDYLAAAAPDAWPYEPHGTWPFEGGEAAQGTSGVVDTVRNGAGTVAYVDASRAGDLGVVSVMVGDEYVPYSAEAASAIVDASPISTGRAPGDLSIEIDRTSTAAGVYPIVLISYLIGCAEYSDPTQAELVREYFTYVISDDAQQTAAEYAGSAPISPTLQQKAEEAVALIQ